MKQAPPPKLVMTADLWTLAEHPSAETEWTLEEKCRAIKAAGFDAVSGFADARMPRLTESLGLRFAGLFDVPQGEDFVPLVRALVDQRAEIINVQLGTHNTTADEALRLTLGLMQEADRRCVNLHLEVHRGTCTETPEKACALADAYQRQAGKPLRLTFDHSHLAVVGHLAPEDFSRRLLDRPDLLQSSNLTHCRPFNGHHCQVPVTNGYKERTREFNEYLPFVEDLFKCWLAGPRPRNELWVVPELGPVSSGYGISTCPSPWEDAQVVKRELETIWNRILH